MFGARFIAFIIAVFLAIHVIPPSDGWFIALAFLIALSMFRSLAMAPWTIFRWTVRDLRGRDWAAARRSNRWADEWWS